ncbi:hypothetical protein VTJ83DRAFT_1557 [Remersonia thermophila]|uniref:Enoyl reductase (ER) domain-containing protein n=1 Tax=Remersonia thermophila TaxID=72144 RepID=A0ABR4DG94_9PEZI
MTLSRVKASVLHGARDLRLEERELGPLGPQDVQVAVKTTGLCGSDLHYFNHFRNGDILVREPLTLGHESAGIVTAVGSDVTALRVGDPVALEVGLPCGSCRHCRSNAYNICPDMRFRSSAKAFPHAQGTLQEAITHPARWCHKLPPAVSLELGGLAEPLSVAIHACDRAQIDDKVAADVLVLGAGTVGLLCAAVARSLNQRVAIADIQPDRVRFALDNGFAHAGYVVPPTSGGTIDEKLQRAKNLAEDIKAGSAWREEKDHGDHPGPQRPFQFDVAFECTGVESSLQTAIYATNPGGLVMIIGMGNPVQTLPISAAALREVDLRGVFRYRNTYPRAIELLAKGNPNLPDLSKLITHRFQGLGSIPRAFDTAARVKDDHGKLVLKVMVEL